jgi:hypothetical protein
MSVRGMMQTVFLTELRELQPDISKDALTYIMESILQFEAESVQEFTKQYFNQFEMVPLANAPKVAAEAKRYIDRLTKGE